MCYSPIHIRNKIKRISIYGGQQAFIDVPCGKCAECRKNKRLEWYFRTYYMVDECIRKGGYVLSDTLTYRPADVPMLSRFVDVDSLGIHDHMVFDSQDWRNFLKRLRRHLDYHYPGVEIKYFLTSEYGTDENCTHRPHYHIMFYVLGKVAKSLHPFKLSRIISKLWTYGRTDGLPYKTRKYVAENVFGYNTGYDTSKDVYKVCGYISKYITKDSLFQKTINSRLKVLKEKLYPEVYTVVERMVSQYHRQSQGFGAFFCDMISPENYCLAFDNACTLGDSKKVKLTIPLPLYYKRRLFYTLKKADDGTLYWTPNERGHEFIEHNSLAKIGILVNRISNTYINMDPVSRSYVNLLLNGRSFEDFAIYKLFYKDRFRAFGVHSHKLLDDECNLLAWLQTIKESLFTYSYTDFEYLSRDTFLNTLTLNDYEINYDNYIKQNTFTETSHKLFYHFDKLDSFLNNFTCSSNIDNEIYFEYIEEREKFIKQFLP